MSELSEMVALLLAEQATEEKLAETSPLLEETQSRLRDQLKVEGGPAIAKLKAIGASDDFRAVSLIQQRLDLSRLQSAGVSSDVVSTLESTLRQFFALYSGSLYSLEEKFAHRIGNLTPDDCQPGRYQEPSIADQIARDIHTTVSNVPEVAQRLDGLRRLVARLVSGPRLQVEGTWQVTGRTIGSPPEPNRPTTQVTES